MRLFAKTLGVVLHPVLLVLIGIFIVVQASTGLIEEAFYWTFLSALFSLLVGGFVFWGVRKGFFNNFDVSNRKQRVILYPFVIFVVILFAFFVYVSKGPVVLIIGSSLFIVALAILDVVNRKIKASIHVATVASLSTGFLLLHGLNYSLILLLIPLSAYARVVGKRHTLKEVIVGAFFGIALTLGGVYIVKLFL